MKVEAEEIQLSPPPPPPLVYFLPVAIWNWSPQLHLKITGGEGGGECREKTWSVPAPRRPHDAVRHICTKEQEEAGSKGRENMEKCFMKAKEEPPACMFYGLNVKTTLSIPAA